MSGLTLILILFGTAIFVPVMNRLLSILEDKYVEKYQKEIPAPIDYSESCSEPPQIEPIQNSSHRERFLGINRTRFN